jgi:hypothetical protein
VKRSGHHRQTLPRITCLAHYVRRLDDPCMPKEAQRRLLQAHHGTWSEPMSAEELLSLLAEATRQDEVPRT